MALEAIKGHEIPEIPHEVIQLEKELKAKFPSIVDIANIINKNTTLSGEVLKLINSPVLKLKLKISVTSIQEAVKFLGIDNIYNLVAVSALKKLFRSNDLHEDIMNNSLDVAYCMAEISDYVEGISRDEAYMLGLFHNAGALMLASINKEQYSALYSSSQSLPLSILQREEAIFNTNHAMVGVLVTQKWRLPVEMIHATMLHHTQFCSKIKNYQVKLMVAMLKVANSIVAEISLGAYHGGEMKSYEQDGVKELMLQAEDLKEVRSGLMSYSIK